MAIDDAEKRRSAGGSFLFPVFPSVTSNAGQDQQWRQQAAWVYSGILAGAAAPSLIALSVAATCPDLRVTLD